MIRVVAEIVSGSRLLVLSLDETYSTLSSAERQVNPLANHHLYNEAERACRAAFVFHSRMSLERRAKLMDKAARAVFRQAGTPADAADLYACAITANIIERAQNTSLQT
jgi:hypothetical protein